MRYRAFLSYSHANQKQARWIHKSLESYRPPKAIFSSDKDGAELSLKPIFRDRDELSSSANLSDAVTAALRNSEWLIVVCSPYAVRSRWVNEEIRVFRELGRSDRILSIIIGGTPNSGDEYECFPSALVTGLDGKPGSIEPVAADARRHGDGKRNAILKIAAGILGLQFDALKQRHQVRRFRQLVAATAGSVLIAAITIVLAISATLARDEAERRRMQAENLVDFMLGDLQENLRELGRLDLYQSIGDEAMEYFESLRDDEVDNRALAQRSRNLRQIGEVRQDQGNLDDALLAFEESNLISFRLVGRNPDDLNIQIGLAQSLFYVGSIYFQRGSLAEAKLHFEQAIPIVEAVSRKNPDNVEWLRELGYVYTNIGRILELEGNFSAALNMYDSVMSVNRQLVQMEPDEIEWVLEVAFAHNNLGKVQATIGKLKSAEENYRQDLLLKRTVLESNPRHNIRRSYVAVSEYFLGQLLSMRGKQAEAVTLLQNAQHNFETVNQADPDKIAWLGRLANVKRELGVLYTRSGQSKVGQNLMDESINYHEQYIALVGSDVNANREYAWTLLRKARMEVLAGRMEMAEQIIKDSERLVDVLTTQQPNNIEATILETYMLLVRGSATTASGTSKQSSTFAGLLDLVDSEFAGSSDPRVLSIKAQTLELSNRASEAAAIREQLRVMGFDTYYL